MTNYQKARQALREAGAKSSPYYVGTATRSHDPTGRLREPKPMRKGEFEITYGLEPTEKDVKDYMRAIGMKPDK